MRQHNIECPEPLQNFLHTSLTISEDDNGFPNQQLSDGSDRWITSSCSEYCTFVCCTICITTRAGLLFSAPNVYAANVPRAVL